jgi:hypothetical protein
VARLEQGLLVVARDMGAVQVEFRSDRAQAWRRLLGPAWQHDGDDRFWRAL